MLTVALDFDGVIHSYTSGWTGPKPIDPPVEGALEFLRLLKRAGWNVIIFTTRASTPDGWGETKSWLAKYNMMEYVDEITWTKPKASLYVDDRGHRFMGDFEELTRIFSRRADLAAAAIEPWNRRA